LARPTSQPTDAPAEIRPLQIGRQPDGRILVPTNQFLTPAGKQILFDGRPVDLALAENGHTLVAKNTSSLEFIDVATGRIKQTLPLPRKGGAQPPLTIFELMHLPFGEYGKPPAHVPPGFSVVGLLAAGGKVYASDSQNHLRVARRRPDGSYVWDKPIAVATPKVKGVANPAGMALGEPNTLWTTSTRGNSVQRINLRTGLVEQVVPVGVAPYTICRPRPDRFYVTNWGGDPPKKGQPQALSSDTPVRTDPRTGIADQGSVSLFARTTDGWRQDKTIGVGLHSSGMIASPHGRFVYVANANSDTVSVIDTGSERVVETISCRPEAGLPFGSGTNALAISPDGATLYAACATNNCIAVIRLGARANEAKAVGRPARSSIAGLIPTGWYPGAVLPSRDGAKLFVANVKGVGSLSRPRPVAQGKNTHDFLGSVSIIDVPGAEQLAHYTRQVNRNNRLAFSLAGLEKPRPHAPPVPVPLRHGEPSVFKHVVYIIKENRTYDQILGDMKEGNGDPSLTLFGEEVTPNQHALARQFTLFDNFYCSGALSATGHQWVNEAYVTDYLEKAFGGFARSYPNDGDDLLAFASSGFLWNNALTHGKTFRNYGEFTKTTYRPRSATWTDVYDDYKNRTRKVKLEVKANIRPMAPYTHPDYPGFPLIIQDVYRARIFVEDLHAYERKGELPNLVYIFLPCDHTTGIRPGSPTPRAMLADNDLALGRVVEAITRSKFWLRTCIFVVEDDPQFGFDHVDGHRTLVQVISPYTRRRFVDHSNYNQTGMVKTIELILGLPCMNQLDLSATPMRNCFQATPDLTPYTSVPNRIPLDEMNAPVGKLRGKARYWAKKSMELDFDKEDEADEDTLNRILWHATKGYDMPYPTGSASRGQHE
jgi:YVTN family beta-propeller protein